MKKLIVFAIPIFFVSALYAQVATWGSDGQVTMEAAGYDAQNMSISGASGTLGSNNDWPTSMVRDNAKFISFSVAISVVGGVDFAEVQVPIVAGANGPTLYDASYDAGSGEMFVTTGGTLPATVEINPTLTDFTGTITYRIYLYNAADNMGGVTLNGNSELPIELTAFSGKRVGSAIELHWRTATEKDNAYMEVQRSKDGKRFEALQQIAGKTGGNSYTPQDYHFTDEQPLAGVNYYRLRQVDFDGKEEYHNIIAVLFQDKDFDKNITIFPTIVKDQLNIALPQEADSDGELYISDMNGRVLLRQPFERGMQQYTWDLPQLAQGAYVLSVKTGRELLSTRFVKN